MNLPFNDKTKELIMGSKEFNPVQKAALPFLLENKNMIVAAPTASGKTLIAEIAIVKNFMAGGKSIYLCPLRALASEKYNDFKKYEQIGMRIAISTGDLDAKEKWLGGFDLIILSNEKADSLLRHKALPPASLVIADEIHLLNDAGRGPTLEIVLTRLMEHKPQILGLSATISNADEIAEWLSSQTVKSDYRPIKLEKGVFYPDNPWTLDMDSGKKEFNERGDAEVILCNKIDRQALVFVSTRSSAEAAAEKLTQCTGKDVKAHDIEKLAKEIESVLSVPTKQCKRLANCVRSRTAFHHAGLMTQQKKLVEDAFREGKIKFLTATPSLAMGVNLPAHTVIIRDTKRYDSEYGSGYLPVLEVYQMQGRAGRPKYDTEGRAIIVAKSKAEAKELKEMYIKGEPEPIYSKLSVEPVLRMQTLALISSGIESKTQLREVFAKTFFAHQYKDMKEVTNKVERILKELEAFRFIKIGDDKTIHGRNDTLSASVYADFIPAFEIDKDVSLKATMLGKRVSELYIDPLSAAYIIQNISAGNDVQTTNGRQSILEKLMVMTQCNEIPNLSVRKSEQDDIEDRLAKSGLSAPDVWDVNYYDFISAFKTSLVINDWMDEKTENYMLEKYNITPGELYSKTTTAEWLLYAATELAIVMKNQSDANQWNKLRLRVKNGVKEELLKLIMLKGIGRARARKLYDSGIKDFLSIKQNEENVVKILGQKVAKQIIEEANKERLVKYGHR